MPPIAAAAIKFGEKLSASPAPLSLIRSINLTKKSQPAIHAHAKQVMNGVASSSSASIRPISIKFMILMGFRSTPQDCLNSHVMPHWVSSIIRAHISP